MEPPEYSTLAASGSNTPAEGGSSHTATNGVAPAPTSKLVPGFLTRSCICLYLENPITFIHPVPATADGVVPESTIAGHAILNLLTAKRIKTFTVCLVGYEEVNFRHRSPETQMLLEQELTLPLPVGSEGVTSLSSPEVPPGAYHLPFTFNVPGTVPANGRTKHGRTRYRLIARAKGAGVLSGTVEVEQAVVLTVNCAYLDPIKGLAMSEQAEDVSTELGPYRIHVHSTLFVVAGLVSLRFRLPSLPQAATIHDFRVSIEQSWRLVSSTAKDPQTGRSYEEAPATDIIVVAQLDGAHPPDARTRGRADGTFETEDLTDRPELARLQAGDSWEMSHLMRLPSDATLRPSSHPSTVTNIHITHRLVFRSIYELSDGTRRSLLIRRPVYLNSCCCLLASMMLPAYDCPDSLPFAPDLSRVGETRECLCGLSLQDLKSAQDPSKYIDEADVPSVIVPIKPDAERADMTAAYLA